MSQGVISTKVKLDGEKEYRDALAALNRSYKTLTDKLAYVTECYADNADGTEALRAKGEVLQQQLDKQREKVATLEKALESVNGDYDESSKVVQEWEQKLFRAKTENLKLEKALRDFHVDPTGYVCSDSGASTGGMDIPPLVLHKWFHLPVSATMMAFDIAILLVQAVFSPVRQVLYGIVMVIIHTIVMDKMLLLGSSKTQVKIISTKSDEILSAILSDIDRGVTILHSEGGYTREPASLLLTVVSNRELPRLERLVHSIDPECFMIVSRVTEVAGRGFSLDKNYQ